MRLITNPAMWASLGSLLAAIGLELIPAQQIGEHVVAAVAAISGIIGIINSIRQRNAAQEPAKEPAKES